MLLCSNVHLFKYSFVQILLCSNAHLFKCSFVKVEYMNLEQMIIRTNEQMNLEQMNNEQMNT